MSKNNADYKFILNLFNINMPQAHASFDYIVTKAPRTLTRTGTLAANRTGKAWSAASGRLVTGHATAFFRVNGN